MFSDQEEDCLIIGLDTALVLDFIKVILGMRGNLDSSLRNFPLPFGKILIMGVMNSPGHTIVYSRTRN